MRNFGSIVVFPILVTLAACGSPPTAPPPVPDAPTLSCPASASVDSPEGAAMPVTFTVPTAVGGQTPVTVTCTRVSGSAFALGSTIVSCTATDALARQASCNFNVTVTALPRISKTRFLAFGDSITFGRCDAGGADCPPYTVRLDELLRERYTRQTFTITNVGVPGEIASDDIADPRGLLAGQDRLAGEMSRYNPEVVLLMEGANDLYHEQDNPEFAILSVELALDRMVSIAQARGVTVLLATLSPQRSPAPPGTVARDTVAAMIPLVNDRIRAVAASRGVTVVDVYAAMVNDIPTMISGDNLHPTAGGLRRIGETFFASIRSAFDVTPTDAVNLLSSAPRIGWEAGPSRLGGIGTPLQPVAAPRVRRR
ncbi:MAG: GDSL-type esterase/lipase family protein [Acidobacteria bacterium]|nr:GDSL-type esterase/lipase family protein [Acidobacteriota bacterium]